MIVLILIFSTGLSAQKIRVAAAGNLRYVMDDIKAAYAMNHSDVKVEVVLGASGALLQQIMNGAQFDFFMAADKTFPDKLKEQGAAVGDVKTYAYGRLALWSNVVDMTKGVAVVTENSVVYIAVAKPDVAPYGERAIQCLKYYGLYEQVKPKIVYADNIAQAAQYAVTGNAEVGFIALALVLAPDMKGKGTYFIPDKKSYTPVEQACVLVKTREQNSAASKFMDFVLSATCKPIFEKYGYILP
ncbi:MAG TPA: molybdate ABC transporter substrate-binding protein [Bacteroidota bacterium]|nr:molybdate ABC transporter substrate-binding protein [Bacteroidota bacterium]